jgi:subtilisin family serine protease
VPLKKNFLQMKKYKIITLLLFAFTNIYAQKNAPENWFNLDYKTNKVYGVSTEKTYTELLSNKKSKPVIVAVIDGGTEVTHEDLKDVIWVNKNEEILNSFDNDSNGYIDDVNGWNFIGGEFQNVVQDNMEITRIYKKYNNRYLENGALNLNFDNDSNYKLYAKAKILYEKKLDLAKKQFAVYSKIIEKLNEIKEFVKTDLPSKKELKAFPLKDRFDIIAYETVLSASKKKTKISDLIGQFTEAKDYFKSQLDFHLNLDLDTRKIVGDNYDDVNEKNYGNNRVSGPKGEHGTHVAGIIAANRNNNMGIKGVADNAQIMVLRVVPDGDERDKDIANAIMYAADNGAKIINMSFGKSLSPNKQLVDDAVKYAMSKDVLLIHAAGNDNSNIDTIENFPNATFLNSEKANTWIEVGASSWKKKKFLTADFSNFGKQTVDLFAPGVDINSCVPNSKYESFNGTSMAAPVVAGIAATLRAYFPEITALQTKQLIMESVIKYNKKVFIPGTKTKVKLNAICVTGGIANLYNAVKLGMEKGYKMSN